MPSYTLPKVSKTLKNITKLIEQQDAVKAKTMQLREVMHRIEWALHTDFDEYLKSLLDAEKLKQAAKLKVEDPEGYKFRNPKARILQRARAAVIHASPYPVSSYNARWEDFTHIAKRTHEKDRAHYIKEGSIKEIKS